jgi:class 3 adenylate cyclase/tetratricopeptide (TPR) repeat protein
MVFADLVDSTQLATDLDPEELRGRLAPFFDVARSALEEHGGTVEKYVGDAVMAVFGVPVTHGDDPDRAVAAALALTERVRAMDPGLDLRTGIETGEVLALERAGDLSVTGEAVNAAARLQQAAQPGEVLVGERAARACRASELSEAEPVEAKGFPAPLRAWRAQCAGTERAPTSVPFVGREDDMALLEVVYRRAARDRVPELVTITGDAGVGKTRLASELTDRLAAASPTPEILLGRNPPYGRGIAFWALGEILRAAAGAQADDSVANVHDRLAERLSGLGADDGHELARSLATALGGGDTADGDVEDELKRAWRRLVALLAGERPLVIGIDDAHWADDGLLDLVEEVVFRLDDVPLVVLCTSRPELLERRPDFGRAARNVTQIELRPLTAEATDELAVALLPPEDRALAARVARASGGNPFFAEEVVQAIVEGRHGEFDHLPDTVQAAIAARLDLLPPAEKRALQHASVLGPNFLQEALDDLLGGPSADALAALAQKALVQERLAVGPGRFGFRHHLIRDVAYASLPRADRAALHERAADGILGRAGERYPELAELVAYHRVQAAELAPGPKQEDAARQASLEAAAVAERRGAMARAQELFEQAAALAASPSDRVKGLRLAGDLALHRWRGDDTLRLLREAAEVSEEAGLRQQAAITYARLVEVIARMGGIVGWLPREEVETMLRRGQELVPEDDVATRGRLQLNEAWIAWRFGAWGQMAEPARKGWELARTANEPSLLSNGLDAMSAVAWEEGRYRDAVSHNRERIELLAKERGDPKLGPERSDALHMMIESMVATGEYRAAAGYAEQARELDLSIGAVYSGWARGLLPAFFMGEWDSALEMARQLRDAWTAADRPPIAALAAAVACAGAIHGFRGNEPASSDWFEFARSIAPPTAGQRSGVLLLQSEVDLHRGRFQDAAERVAEPPEKTFWWRAIYAAVRAEAMLGAGDPRAGDALTAAEGMVGDHAYARGVLLRTKGLRDGDPRTIREALSVFSEIECPYQAARTGWLLGGADRGEAERRLAGLGATLPAADPAPASELGSPG